MRIMLSHLKQKGECPECGKAYQKPPSGTVTVVCGDCVVVFDGEEVRNIDEIVAESQRSRFGV